MLDDRCDPSAFKVILPPIFRNQDHADDGADQRVLTSRREALGALSLSTRISRDNLDEKDMFVECTGNVSC